MYKQFGSEALQHQVANPILCSRIPGFSMERQNDREQRARGMCRIADRTFHSLTYNPNRGFADKHQRIIDLKRHCPRKFDQSAGFFSPISAHLAYPTEAPFRFLDVHQHGHVAFGKLPAGLSEAEKVKARLFESGITRRKHMWLHPTGDVPCPVPKLSREQQAQAVPPQKFFRSARTTKLEETHTPNEVDATCGTLEVLKTAIETKFCARNKGHVMSGDCTREQRAKHGYESGKELPSSCKLAPLRVKYSGVGGRGFMKYVPIGEDPKQQISFGKAPRMHVERRVKDAVDRTKVEGNSELCGDPLRAFDALRRKTTRNISFGPGFKSATEQDFD